MKKIISIILVCALIAALALALVSCTGDGNEDETKLNVLPPEFGDENETVKDPEYSAETEDWGLGWVPLN